MRAREFVSRNIRENKTLTLTIPISISVPSDDTAAITVQQPEQPAPLNKKAPGTIQPTGFQQVAQVDQDNYPDEENGDPDVDVMVPPLQQALELDKAGAGKNSKVIDQLTQDEEDEDDENLPLAYR